MRPGKEVRRCVKSVTIVLLSMIQSPSFGGSEINLPNGEFLSIRNDHHPLLGCRVPDYFRISELGTVNGYDRVVGIFSESITSVSRISHLLFLSMPWTL